jgi:hypothetical protein
MNDVVTVLEDLNDCLNTTVAASMPLRTAPISQLTQGTTHTGFVAPRSLFKQVNSLLQPPSTTNPVRTRDNVLTDVSQTILTMLRHSGLHASRSLQERLQATDTAALEGLVGADKQACSCQCAPPTGLKGHKERPH